MIQNFDIINNLYMKKIFKFFKDKIGNDLTLPILDENKRSLICKNQNLTKFPFRIPRQHPIEAIDISFNEIPEIPPFLSSLKFLDYSNNNLKVITEDNEKAILTYKELNELRISSNMIETIPSSFKSITTLKTFILSNNKIKEFNVPFSNLNLLDLSCNLLTDFKVYLKTLESLNLNFNLLSHIDFISESNVSNLNELLLSGNDLTLFPDNIQLNSLTILNISFNKIQGNLPDFSKITPKLEILDFSYNEISTFPSSLPTTIKLIRGCHNKITEIPPLDKYTSLESLVVEENQIQKISSLPSSINDISFDFNSLNNDDSLEFNLPKINKLLMTNNNLTEIPDFHQCTKVQYFTMSYNRLTDSFDVKNLAKSIIRLDLSCNSIKFVPPELFTSLPELKQLFLFQNEIGELPVELEQSSLTILNVSNNPLTSLPPLPPTLVILCAQGCNFVEFPISRDSMKSAKSLTCIDLSNNSIESIPVTIETDSSDNSKSELKDEDLFLNRIETLFFSCNKLTQFPEFSNSIHQIDLSQNLLQSVSIERRLDNLIDLDISHNKLFELKITEKLPSLSTLKMSHNVLLSFKFSYANFPKLDCLDISHTGIVLDNGQPKKKMRELIRSCSYSISPMMKIFTDDDNVGYAEMKGNRKTMEDALIIRHTNLFDIFGVVDGHAGDRTASLTAFKLPEFIDRFDKNLAIRAIQQLNSFLFNKKVADGATIAFVILKRNSRLISVNIGDTRSFIVKSDGSIINLSIDHKPSDRIELEQIRKKGSFVSIENRTFGILSVSRAIGDFGIRGISALPNVSEHIIAEDDYRVVVACDGVFDVLTNEEVGRIVLSEESPQVAAYKVRNTAYSHLSDDNISVIVANLHSDDENISIETANSSSLLL